MQLLDEALEAAVKLSHRYIPARQLPDKSVSLLDTACARVAISQHAVPAEVEDSRRRIEALDNELEIIEREKAVGMDVAQREARARREAGSGEGTAGQARRALARGKGAGRPDPRDSRATSWHGRQSRRNRDALEQAADSAAKTVSIDAGPKAARADPRPKRAEELRTKLRELQAKLAELQGERR